MPPELLRIHAFVLAAQGQTEAQAAKLVESMELAQKLGATSWQLRAATDLAQLWQTEARPDEAKGLLQPIFQAFTDGFETRDLVRAARPLAELG